MGLAICSVPLREIYSTMSWYYMKYMCTFIWVLLCVLYYTQGNILMREDSQSDRLEQIYVDLHKLLDKKDSQVEFCVWVMLDTIYCTYIKGALELLCALDVHVCVSHIVPIIWM